MKTMKIGVLMAVLMTLLGSVSAQVIDATDSSGNSMSTFSLNGNVYLRGYSLPVGTYCLYICSDAAWNANDPINCDVTGDGIEVATVSSVGDFDITPVSVWSPTLTVGYYDIIATHVSGTPDSTYGCPATAVYTPSRGDIIEDEALGVCEVTVVPESVIAVALIALLVPGMIYVARKRR